jgi:iron complex transport system substrate-binding protein
MGFPVFYLDLESPDSFRRDIRSLGDLFGEADRAAEVVRWYDQRVEAVARQAAGVARPRVLLLQSAGSGAGASCSIPPASWIQSWMTAAAGGDPVWLEWNGGGGWLKVSLEQAAAWRPEVVLVVSYQEPAAAAADRLRSLGLFAAKVLPFPSDFMSWDQADARWILGLQWMAAALHPDRASGFDLEAEVTRFYGDLYGVDASTVRSTVVPLLSRSLGTR